MEAPVRLRHYSRRIAFTFACTAAYASTVAKCNETRDLSPYDVVVSGSTEDFDAPALSSVSATPATVSPGTPVTVRFAATDLHPITAVRATWKHKDHDTYFSLTSSDPIDLAGGSFTKPMPHVVYNGNYALQSVSLTDANGFAGSYSVDGTVSYSAPPGIFYPHPSRPTGTHAVSFASSSLAVTDSSYDGPAPVLTSLSVGPSPTVAGGKVTVSYATKLNSSTLTGVSVEYALEGVPGVQPLLSVGAAGTQGEFTGTLPQRVGTYRLQRVVVTDSAMRTSQYGRDGRVLDDRGRVIGTHTVDLAGQDVVARPTAPTVVGISRPQSADLRVRPPVDEAQDLTSYRIVVSPGGRVIDVPVSSADQRVIVNGLRNGTAYTFAVTSQSKVGPGTTTKVTVTPAISGNIWAAGDVNGDRRSDLFAKVPGAEIRLYRSAGYPKFQSPSTVLKPSETHNFPSAAISGQAAFLTVESGALQGNLVDRSGRFVGATRSGSGWGGMRAIDGSADLTGDGKPDVVAVTSTGVMRIYRGDGNGRFTTPIQVGGGWGTMLRVFVPGDVTGDRKADVMAIDSAGVLWIYPGNGRGGFTTKKRVGSGWSGMGAVFAARDLTGDGRADLGAVTMDGKLRLYPGRGNGTFASPATIGSGWNAFF